MTRRTIGPGPDASEATFHAWQMWARDHGLDPADIPLQAKFTVDDEHHVIAYDSRRDHPDTINVTVATAHVNRPIAPFPGIDQRYQPTNEDHDQAIRDAIREQA